MHKFKLVPLVLIGLFGIGALNVNTPKKTDSVVEREDAVFISKPSDSEVQTIATNANAVHDATSDEHTYTSNSPISSPEKAKETSVSPYVIESIRGDEIITKNAADSYPLRAYKTLLTPNDPQSGQWWESAINLPSAWDISTGSSETTIAIIDTGFALEHEEFQGRWATNPLELGPSLSENPSQLNCSDQSLPLDRSCNLIDDNYDGVVDNETGFSAYENPSKLNCSDQSLALDKSCNLIDDDENGLVDDWRGWDFVSFDNSVQAGQLNPTGSGTKHASYVTGVAAANADNGVGLTGVNWQAKILPIQAIDDDGYGNSVSVARAIRYATDQGADVINLSLGGSLPDAFLRQTIAEAIKSGIIVVAAAGNDGCNCISYPANYPEVVAVGALDTSGNRASFSSYGSNLDIMAPGSSILTASWSNANGSTLYASGIAGTSLASPLVSASLATLKSMRPEASITQLIALLSETTDRIAIADTTPKSTTLGFGKLDLLAALNRSQTPFNTSQLTSFAHVSHGDSLPGVPALEADSTIIVYGCEETVFGSTAVYKLTKGSSAILSASTIEIAYAASSGYSLKLIAYMCTLQPHDSIDQMRTLNIYSEFENRFFK